jgi:lipoate-protein ligase A
MTMTVDHGQLLGARSRVSNCQSSLVNRELVWWLWLDQTPRPGWENMAIDQALLDLASQERFAVLRLYRWNPFCLSFGRHEPALRRYGREPIEARGIDVVRRPTGGRAVWHARELTYAVAAPAVWGTLRDTYRTIHSLLANAIQALGVPAVLAPDPDRAPRPGDGPCFAAAVGGEVTLDGRKLVGSAQLRGENAFLQHGSLLLEDDQKLVHELAGEIDPVASELPLSAAVGHRVTFEEAAQAISQAAAEWTGPWLPLTDATGVVARANRHAGRFRSSEWTWER